MPLVHLNLPDSLLEELDARCPKGPLPIRPPIPLTPAQRQHGFLMAEREGTAKANAWLAAQQEPPPLPPRMNRTTAIREALRMWLDKQAADDATAAAKAAEAGEQKAKPVYPARPIVPQKTPAGLQE